MSLDSNTHDNLRTRSQNVCISNAENWLDFGVLCFRTPGLNQCSKHPFANELLRFEGDVFIL